MTRVECGDEIKVYRVLENAGWKRGMERRDATPRSADHDRQGCANALVAVATVREARVIKRGVGDDVIDLEQDRFTPGVAGPQILARTERGCGTCSLRLAEKSLPPSGKPQRHTLSQFNSDPVSSAWKGETLV